MEVGEIGVVLSRASELRLKVNECIRNSSIPLQIPLNHHDNGDYNSEEEEGDSEDEGNSADVEKLSLSHIRDALECLEMQLSTLQNLQQQQRAERETALAELDESRRGLIEKLKEYKGRQLSIIQEACAFAFAGEPPEQKDDIILPPYGHQLPNSFIPVTYDSTLLRQSVSSPMSKTISQQPAINAVEKSEILNGNIIESGPEESMEKINGAKRPQHKSVVGHLFRWTTKAALVIAGVVSIYTLAKREPKLRGTFMRVMRLSGSLSQKIVAPLQPKTEASQRCPPGKVSVLEGGIQKCVVKERVEVPFEPAIKGPDISYGCG